MFQVPYSYCCDLPSCTGFRCHALPAGRFARVVMTSAPVSGEAPMTTSEHCYLASAGGLWQAVGLINGFPPGYDSHQMPSRMLTHDRSSAG